MDQIKPVQRRLPKGSHKGRQSAHNVTKYSIQRVRTNSNKLNAQKKHLALHPNDLQAKDNIFKSWEK